MNIKTAFPSNYIKAADLQGRDINVTIRDVKIADVGTAQEPDEKPVVYFEGKEKGLVLNKTNANTIAGIYGDDTDLWRGKSITLFESQTEFQGRPTACVRVRLRPPQLNGQAKSPPPAMAPSGGMSITEDDIPF